MRALNRIVRLTFEGGDDPEARGCRNVGGGIGKLRRMGDVERICLEDEGGLTIKGESSCEACVEIENAGPAYEVTSAVSRTALS